MTIEITPRAGVLGAEIRGVDARSPPDPVTLEFLWRALHVHGVLVLPSQRLSPAEQVEFTRPWGPLEVEGLTSSKVPGHPEVIRVGNVDGATSFAPRLDDPTGLEWHSDLMQRPIPAHVSILHAIETPARGGDTLFACMQSAWEALDEPTRERYRAIRLVHTIKGLNEFRRVAGQDDRISPTALARESQAAVHPLVRTHPETGRPCLYFATKVTVAAEGLSDGEFQALHAELCSRALREELIYRHRWRPGDLVIWDNRRVLHAATPAEPGTRRLLHRTTVQETRPVA